MKKTLLALSAFLLGACQPTGSGSGPDCSAELAALAQALKVEHHVTDYDSLERQVDTFMRNDSEAVFDSIATSSSATNLFWAGRLGILDFKDDRTRFVEEHRKIVKRYEASSHSRESRASFFAESFRGVENDVAIALIGKLGQCRTPIQVVVTPNGPTQYAVELRYNQVGPGKFTVDDIVLTDGMRVSPSVEELSGKSIEAQRPVSMVLGLTEGMQSGWATVLFKEGSLVAIPLVPEEKPLPGSSRLIVTLKSWHRGDIGGNDRGLVPPVMSAKFALIDAETNNEFKSTPLLTRAFSDTTPQVEGVALVYRLKGTTEETVTFVCSGEWTFQPPHNSPGSASPAGVGKVESFTTPPSWTFENGKLIAGLKGEHTVQINKPRTSGDANFDVFLTYNVDIQQ